MWDFDPFEEIRRMKKEMDSMFDRFFSRDELKEEFARKPISDVKVKDDNVIAIFELPAVDKKDIILKITNNYIEIRAQKKHELRIEKKGFKKLERSYGSFYKLLPLPVEVKADEAKADFKSGILKIIIPVAKKKKQIKEIRIR